MKYTVDHFNGAEARVVSRVPCRTLVVALSRFNDKVAQHMADPEAIVLLTLRHEDRGSGTVLASKSRTETQEVRFNPAFYAEWLKTMGPACGGPELTPVLFRMERNEGRGESCLAVFPTVPEDESGKMSCYSHVGQHASVDYGYYLKTRAATPEEYAELKRELESYGPPDAHYRLRICRRMTRGLRDEFKVAFLKMVKAPGVQSCRS